MAKPIEIVGPCPLCQHTSLHVQVGAERPDAGSTASKPLWIIPLECQDCKQGWEFRGTVHGGVADGDGIPSTRTAVKEEAKVPVPAGPTVALDVTTWGSDPTWLKNLEFESKHWDTYRRLEGRYTK